MSRTAVITGITGQDGFYLCQLLLAQNVQVIGTTRSAKPFSEPLKSLVKQTQDSGISEGQGKPEQLMVVTCDLTDIAQVQKLFSETEPDEVYHLAAQTSIPVSFEKPVETLRDNAISTANLLEVIRKQRPQCRFLLASSSEVFGDSGAEVLTERSPMQAQNPYAASKIYAQQLVQIYRERYGMHAASAILFNHESPLRPVNFVSQKIVTAAVNISLGRSQSVELGNLSAVKDWSYAGDVVAQVVRMMHLDQPVDLMIASGESHSVREFCAAAFRAVKMPLEWKGAGLEETGTSRDGIVRVSVNPDFYRTGSETRPKLDLSKSERLGRGEWTPFEKLVEIMIEAARVRCSQSGAV